MHAIMYRVITDVFKSEKQNYATTQTLITMLISESASYMQQHSCHISHVHISVLFCC